MNENIAMPTVNEVSGARFPLGSILCTPGAKELLSEQGKSDGGGFGMLTILLLARHQLGDWREMSEHDRLENEKAADGGLRVLSSYRLPGGQTLWVITEADRSTTTILLPSEY